MYKRQWNKETPLWSARTVERQRNRIATISFGHIAKRVTEWAKKRPLIEKMDARKLVAAQMTRAEAEELRQELLIVHKNEGIQIAEAEYFHPELEQVDRNVQFAMWRDVFMEAQDGTFIILANAWGRQLSLDFDEAYRSMNGQGKSSDIIEQLQMLGSGVAESNPSKAIEQYLAAWGSFVTHQGVFIDPNYILDQVIKKNKGNYPEKFFQLNQLVFDLNGQLQEIPLHSEEETEAFNHRLRCLRVIRDANKLAGIYRENGLQQTDYASYYRQILNHRNAKSFPEVVSDLVQIKGGIGDGFGEEDLYKREARPHRVVPAFSHSIQVMSHDLFSSVGGSRSGTIVVAPRY